MKSMARFAPSWIFLGIIVGVAWFTVSPIPAEAQCTGVQGQNAVYAYCGTGGALGIVGSSAFIDASVFNASFPDICTILNGILSGTSTTYPSGGAVIDARGLNSGNTSMTCTTSPWGSGSSYLNVPSTILLPATGGATPTPIQIPSTWILPVDTRLIGEGDNISSGTTIQAIGPNFITATPMISFGLSSLCTASCSGISVENLTLDGQGQAIDGIHNEWSQDISYVNHVSLYQIQGTGLSVSGNASNSGPYSNISFDTNGKGLTSTVCASINGVSGTRGIHGLSCSSESNDANAAVLLDSSNNSLEDIRIVGFYDGIRIGANANAQSNVLRNIIGDTTATGLTPIIVVHITNLGHTVSDVSIMGANNAGGSTGTITIQDDLTGPTQLTDTSVGIYALGEKDPATGGYSRYTTSPSVATWATGSNAPPTSGTTCARGSLYSCIGGSTPCSSKALWGCASNGTGWVSIR